MVKFEEGEIVRLIKEPWPGNTLFGPNRGALGRVVGRREAEELRGRAFSEDTGDKIFVAPLREWSTNDYSPKKYNIVHWHEFCFEKL